MMKMLYRTTPLLLVLALAACQNRQSAGEVPPVARDVTAHTTGLGSTNGKLDANAVWNGSLDACRTGNGPVDACLIDTMREGGASTPALNAARTLAAQDNPGYVSAWQTVEGIGVATLEFPFRANTNQGTWLVDATGKSVDVDEDVPDENTRSLPEYKAFLTSHPDAVAFAPAIASGSDALPDGGVRLRYSTPLRDCHACADVGRLTLGYDFDAKRNFKGRQLVELR